MRENKRRASLVPGRWPCGAIFLAACFVCTGIAGGQDVPSGIAAPTPQALTPFGAQLKAQTAPAYPDKVGSPQQVHGSGAVALSAAHSDPPANSTGARVITLEEAQLKAAPADNNPMARIGELQVEVARQTRLGTKSSFFPQIGSTLTNFHFNKFMGEEIEIHRPVAGTTSTLGFPLAGKDQTFIALTATQPITPLFQLRQLYRINLADERIARAKAGMPVSETASNVEKAYYDLLVAQRQLAFAQAKATQTGNKWLVASSSAPVASGSHDEELIEASNALAIAATRVKELTATLDDLLGWPPDTELQLVPPDPRFEDISLREATDKALAANPEVIEAEQNVVKARAAATLQKLAYVPVVALMGGYAYNAEAIPLLPRDFSFIGIVASYNLFDFGKREHTIKGANAQVEMAEIALQLTKAKVGASVKNSVFELQRSRQLSELTRRLESAIQIKRADYEEGAAEIAAAKKAKVEAEMFQSDLEYRQALAKLKTLMGEQ